MNPILSYLDERISRLNRITMVVVCVFLIFFIGWVRSKTGSEYALSIFYLFPVIFSAWYIGRRTGYSMAVISTISWLAADLSLLNEFSHSAVPFINETFRLIVFLFVAFLASEFKKSLDINKALARSDPLTGIANRRAFFEFAGIELNKARRFNYPVSIIYLDIDNFKLINDRYGHHVGDKLLKIVADTVSNNIRSIDMVARFGGDELGVLLPETDSQGTRILAGKIHQKLLSEMRHHGWESTFSIGAATFHNSNVKVYEMLNIADKLMYLAKKNGKNKIIFQVIQKNKTMSPPKLETFQNND